MMKNIFVYEKLQFFNLQLVGELSIYHKQMDHFQWYFTWFETSLQPWFQQHKG